MTSIIAGLYLLIKSYGLIGVFGIMTLENLGLPIPTEAGFLVARDLINKRIIHLAAALLIITLGHLVGSLISYWIGMRGRHWLITRFKNNKRLIKAENKLTRWYSKYGLAAVLLGRFVGYVRPWASFLAGLAKVSFWPFFWLTLIGSLIWNYFQMLFTQVLILFWQRYAYLHITIGIVLFLSFFGFIIYEFTAPRWKKST